MLKIFELLRSIKDDNYEIRESIVRYIIELAKHHSIRNTILTKKIVSRFFKTIIDELTKNTHDVKSETYLLSLVQLLILVSSVTNSKFYIPGETKEVEQLRKRSITHGIITMADLITKMNKSQSLTKRLTSELLDNLDTIDLKLWIYSVFYYF
jgi:AraC-like DNA-binding protein